MHINFEKLHKNHKYAFADGFLTALVFAWFYNRYKKN